MIWRGGRPRTWASRPPPRSLWLCVLSPVTSRCLSSAPSLPLVALRQPVLHPEACPPSTSFVPGPPPLDHFVSFQPYSMLGCGHLLSHLPGVEAEACPRRTAMKHGARAQLSLPACLHSPSALRLCNSSLVLACWLLPKNAACFPHGPVSASPFVGSDSAIVCPFSVRSTSLLPTGPGHPYILDGISFTHSTATQPALLGQHSLNSGDVQVSAWHWEPEVRSPAITSNLVSVREIEANKGTSEGQ